MGGVGFERRKGNEGERAAPEGERRGGRPTCLQYHLNCRQTAPG